MVGHLVIQSSGRRCKAVAMCGAAASASWTYDTEVGRPVVLFVKNTVVGNRGVSQQEEMETPIMAVKSTTKRYISGRLAVMHVSSIIEADRPFDGVG